MRTGRWLPRFLAEVGELAGVLLTTLAVIAALVVISVGGPRAEPTIGPGHAEAPAPAQPERSPAITEPAGPAPVVETITLRWGDTLWGLAREHGTTVAALQALNGLGQSTLIYAGHLLRIPGIRVTQPSATGGVREIAKAVFAAEYDCAAEIITHESNWDVHATNPRSGAYGLPQALPAEKLAAAGPDWRDNPRTQLTWMRVYIHDRYGNACNAWAFWQQHNPHWY
jgi:LysM repeat protein